MDEILNDVVSAEDLKKFEGIYYKELEANVLKTQSTFNYALCLVRSKYATDIRKGICLLETLYKDGTEEERRDYIYYLAVGYGKLGEYSKGLEYVRKFLSLEPANQQAQNLEVILKKRMERDGLKGIAFVSGAVLAVGAIVGVGLALVKK